MNKVLIGEVLRSHGVNGEVKVFPITRDPHRYKKLKTITLINGEAERQLQVTDVKVQPEFVYLAFQGIETKDEAEKLRGWKIYIDRTQVPSLEDGWYYFELEGMQVYEGDICLGTLTKIVETGSNDVYVVRGNKGEICIPALKSVVKKVDVSGQRMDVELPPGLMEDET
ncbi:MAG: ribosome maturation factor RimM [Desulfitobacteriaceae bacterium]